MAVVDCVSPLLEGGWKLGGGTRLRAPARIVLDRESNPCENLVRPRRERALPSCGTVEVETRCRVFRVGGPGRAKTQTET